MFGRPKQKFQIRAAVDGAEDQIFKVELGSTALKKPLKDALITPFLQAGTFKASSSGGGRSQPVVERVVVWSTDADRATLSPEPQGADTTRPVKDFVEMADDPTLIRIVVHVVLGGKRSDAHDAYASNYPAATAGGDDGARRPEEASPSRTEQQRLNALLATLDS